MMAMAAAQLGYRCHIFAPEEDSVAAEVSAQFTRAEFTDQAALTAFAAQCEVVTYEFENVPVAPLSALGDTPLRAPARALEVAQDRLAEKDFVAGLGGTPAPYRAVENEAELLAAIDEIGVPGILKTRRDGYDGKGQWRIRNRCDADEMTVPPVPLIYEGFVTFEAEFSVILVRAVDGKVKFWDSAQNDHSSGILSRSTVPAGDAVAAQIPAARHLAARVAEALGYVGVLTLEFFATADGPVFNEMAPRVHNSGHWTIEGAVTSQFENHIRAICNLPLGDCGLRVPGATMDNLIGTAPEDCTAYLQDPSAHLHFYGKTEAREGRKMGHVTRLTLQEGLA
ncbi:phosphoribosylaminoimidazole carboxylase [Croceicoccus naphthovorans]|uniref:N5-carboxyaminoimidazole ribonucleotide synthase n=2 Tax=Croceicoccus naphthovorans TaxID=1348774 RepID=A0A0G3XIL7_9SPHN|nr:phosphoribosylaminoimidazole carboxylase [Croceicoccus naphthovorans]